MVTKMKNLLLTVLLTALSANVFSSSYVVWGTTISIYAQTQDDSGSEAHLIRSEKPIFNNGDHPWCGDRAYIHMKDKALFATALAASMSGQVINFIYKDNDDTKLVTGHTNTKCRVTSIFQ